MANTQGLINYDGACVVFGHSCSWAFVENWNRALHDRVNFQPKGLTGKNKREMLDMDKIA